MSGYGRDLLKQVEARKILAKFAQTRCLEHQGSVMTELRKDELNLNKVMWHVGAADAYEQLVSQLQSFLDEEP